jgi:hypothetical protein
MKKLTFLLGIFLTFAALSTQAQSEYKSAIGARLGLPVSFSYKHFITERGALEGNVGFGRSGYLNGWNYFRVGGMYQHHFPIGDIEGFKWYVGGGAFVQFNSYPDYFNNFGYSKTSLGINGVGGVDYKFKNIPLNLSADWMPTIFIGDYYQSFGGGYGAVSVRYVLR